MLEDISREIFPMLIVYWNDVLIAALFQPLRRRIQASIDRHFYRRKYDAQQMLADFGDTSRQDVDLTDLHEQVLAVIPEMK